MFYLKYEYWVVSPATPFMSLLCLFLFINSLERFSYQVSCEQQFCPQSFSRQPFHIGMEICAAYPAPTKICSYAFLELWWGKHLVLNPNKRLGICWPTLNMKMMEQLTQSITNHSQSEQSVNSFSYLWMLPNQEHKPLIFRNFRIILQIAVMIFLCYLCILTLVRQTKTQNKTIPLYSILHMLKMPPI